MGGHLPFDSNETKDLALQEHVEQALQQLFTEAFFKKTSTRMSQEIRING